jgi:hypothetical protein
VKSHRREAFPSILFAGLLGHIFVSVPLLLYVLSTIDGRIVFYVLLVSFQLYVCSLVCLALYIRDEVIPPLAISFLRLFSIFCWGGICFMIYALVGSIIIARTQREPSQLKTSPASTTARTAECSSVRSRRNIDMALRPRQIKAAGTFSGDRNHAAKES